MNEKNKWDLLEHSIPNIVRYILTKYPGTALAGGSLVDILKFDSSAPNDWDIFVNDTNTIKLIADDYLSRENGAIVSREFISGIHNDMWFYECTIYGVKIQLIYRNWQSIGEVFGDFDLRLCKHAITFERHDNKMEMRYHCTEKSANDLSSRQIVFSHARRNFHNTLLRIQKYEKKGFMASADTYKEFYKHITTLNSAAVDRGFDTSTDNRYFEVVKSTTIPEKDPVLTFDRDRFMKRDNGQPIGPQSVPTVDDSLRAALQEEDISF